MKNDQEEMKLTARVKSMLISALDFSVALSVIIQVEKVYLFFISVYSCASRLLQLYCCPLGDNDDVQSIGIEWKLW